MEKFQLKEMKSKQYLKFNLKTKNDFIHEIEENSFTFFFFFFTNINMYSSNHLTMRYQQINKIP